MLAQLPSVVLEGDDGARKVQRRIQDIRQVRHGAIVSVGWQWCVLPPPPVCCRGLAAGSIFGSARCASLQRGPPGWRSPHALPAPVQVQRKAQHAQYRQVEADFPAHRTPAPCGSAGSAALRPVTRPCSMGTAAHTCACAEGPGRPTYLQNESRLSGGQQPASLRWLPRSLVPCARTGRLAVSTHVGCGAGTHGHCSPVWLASDCPCDGKVGQRAGQHK